MARADLLIELAQAAHQRDEPETRRAMEEIIAEERHNQHHLVAERLEQILAQRVMGEHAAKASAEQGFSVHSPRVRLEDLSLPDVVTATISELIEEQHRMEVLRSHGMEPRHRVLLTGPPGNGKTSLAEAVAEALLLPLVKVRYEEVIGSYLGETASRLAATFAFARSRRCVLFFDEFDAVAKERGDEHETGEIKRVVSSLLLQIDDLPSHTVIIGASNHQELLDRAAHRRFQLRLELPPPGLNARTLWFERMLVDLNEPAGVGPTTLARKSAGASYAQLRELTDDINRRRVLEPGTSLRRLIPQRMSLWRDVTAPETHG